MKTGIILVAVVGSYLLGWGRVAFGFQTSQTTSRTIQSTTHANTQKMMLSAAADDEPSMETLTVEPAVLSDRRRSFLSTAGLAFSVGMAPTITAFPDAAMARFVLDQESGDYVEVEDIDWQTEWKQRLDKASSMSQDEIFQAARGAGNIDLRNGPESDSSKKRRAMSACRDTGIRAKANAGAEKECTARVFSGEVDFLLEQL